MNRKDRVYRLVHRAHARRDRRLAARSGEREWILWREAAALRDRLTRLYWSLPA